MAVGPALAFFRHALERRKRRAPARRSQEALGKVHTRTPKDGTPAMSLDRLLAHMAAIVRKRQQALDLLNVIDA